MTSRHTRIVMRGAFLSAGAALVSMACGLAAAIVFTRTLTPEAVGVFNLLLVLTDLLVLINNLGLTTSLPKLVASSPENKRSALTTSALTFQMALSLLIGAVLLGFWVLVRDPNVFSGEEAWSSLFPYLWILPLMLFTANLRDNAMAVLAGLNRYGFRAAGLVCSALFHAGAVFLGLRIFGGGLPTMLMLTLASYAFAAVWFSSRTSFDFRNAFDWRTHRKALAFSWPLYANNLLTFAFTRVDTLFVYALLGQAPAAFFEITAKRLPAYFVRLAVAGTTPYLPAVSALIAHGDAAGASRLLNRTSNVFVLVGYASVFVTLVVQEPLIGLLFPEAYLDALPALGLIMASACLAVQAGLMGQTLIALAKPQLVTAANVASAVVAIGANAVLIPRLGIVGAGWAAVCGTMLANAVQTWLVHRQGVGVNIRHYVQAHGFAALCGLFPWMTDGAVWGLAALGVYLVLFVAGGNITAREMRKAVRLVFRPFDSDRPRWRVR